ncbi:hypothetical protein Tco_0563625 [Tanacetum coccineum]
MVACLERTEENAEFHQIVDFLTTSSIHYALTKIHATVDGKTIVISGSSVRSDLHFNDEDGITCLTNTGIFENLTLIRKGKDFSGRVTPLFASMLAPPIVGGEGSGQPSKPQPPSLTTQPIIEEQIHVTVLSSPQNTQSPRQTLQKDTQLPQTSVPIPHVADEVVFKERDDRVVRDTTTAASLDAAQASSNITKTQSTAMSERASKHSYDSPLPGVNTLGSNEERNEQQDLTDFVPPTPNDSPLSGGHTPGSDEDLVINKLQKKVKILEKALRARTPGMKLFKIGTSRRKGLDKENVSKQGRKSDKTKPMFKDSDFDVLDDAMENIEDGSTAEQITTAGDTLNTASINVSAAGPSTSTIGDIFDDEMITIVDTLMAIRSARPRTTSVMIRNVEEEPRRATPVPTVQSQDKGKGKMVEPEPTLNNPRKAQIQMDEELAQRLFEEEQAQFKREMDADELLAARLQEQEREQFSVDEHARFLVETIAAKKKFFVAQRAAKIRNRPPTRTQLRNQMITYLKHMGKYTRSQLKSTSFEEIQKLYKKEQQWINDFVPMSDESGKKDNSSGKQAESSKKRPRAEHDEESVKKQKLQDDAEKEELRACLDIVQGDDIAINVEYLATKYPIVDWNTYILTENMMYYQIIRADGSSKNYKIFSEMLDDFDRQDVMDLHRLVKERYDTTSPEGYNLLLCGDLKTLFEPCKEDKVWRNQQEKKYPLTQEMLSRMLNRRLEVDHESEMAFELLRFTRSQLKK